jgi:transposase
MMNLPGVTPEKHRDNLGRPTLYRPEYDAQAEKLCELGATNRDLAEFFDVSERTVEEWQVRIESFAVASRVGKIHADEKVKVSAYKLAKGYTYIEQQAIKVRDGPNKERIEIVEVERHVPPNAMMQAKWLAVRGNKEFAETQRVEHSGAIKTDSIDLKGLTDDQLSKYMAFMESVTEANGD